MGQQVLNAIFIGSIYALFAVGYTLVFGVLDILNLAHSAVFMLGAVFAYGLVVAVGVPFWLAALLATLGCAAIGFGIELVAFRPLRRRGAPPIGALLTSIGLALIFVNLTEVRFGAVAGILYGLSQADVNPFMGRDQIELKGLAVIVLGGMGSIPGAVLAGYLLGLAEVAAVVFLGSNISSGVAFAMLFVALVAVPGGLLRGRT